MSLTKAGALEYEPTPFKITKKSAKTINSKERTTMLQSIGVPEFLWAKTKQHRFGVLLTFTIVYVTFSLFGPLIVGLIESL